MQADAFIFALAGLFPATMFDSAHSSHWSELKEMVAFLFCDEGQREAAFFGHYPAPFNPFEAIKSPSMNTLLSGGNVMHALVSGELDLFARYQTWTLFPFGVQSRDVVCSIENPANVVDNLTGFPASRIELPGTEGKGDGKANE